MLVFQEEAKINIYTYTCIIKRITKTICICNFMNMRDTVCGSEPAEILYSGGPLRAKLSL